MARKDGLKPIGFRIDPKIADKFSKFCEHHAGDPKVWIYEFALDWVSNLKDSDYKRLSEPFFQWRLNRKREIKLELANKRGDRK